MIPKNLLNKRITLFTIFILSASIHYGQVITWTGAFGSDFQDSRNWSPQQIPGPQNDVVVPGGTPNNITVGFTDGVIIRSLLIQNGGLIQARYNTVTVDAKGSGAVAAVIVEAGGTLTMYGGQPLKVINATGDGIRNSGTVRFDGGSDLFYQLIIDNVGGVGFNNLGFVDFNNNRSGILITNTSGASISNNGTGFTTQKCVHIDVDNTILDLANNIDNLGIIIERGSGTSDIDNNQGIIHNLGGGTFNVTTNSGVTTSNPNANFSTDCSNDWWRITQWSRRQYPKSGDELVLFRTNTLEMDLDNFTSYDELTSTYVKVKSIDIPAGQSLLFECTTLEVEDINIEGTLYIGDDGSGESGTLIVTNSFSNTGTVENDGNIVNLNGGALGGTINGIGSTVTTLPGIEWTGASSSDWNNSGNWMGGSVPGPGDVANIPDCITCPQISNIVNVASVFIEGSLQVNSNGELNVDGTSLGCNSTGITISGGTLINNGDINAFNLDETGILSLESTITNNGTIHVYDVINKGINLYCSSSIINSSGSTIKLNDITHQAFMVHNGSSLSNQGLLDIDDIGNYDGSTITDDGRGLFIIRNSTSNNSGTFDIDRTGNDAFHTRNNSSSTNSGSIMINFSDADAVEVDIDSDFHNMSSGTIHANDSYYEGLEADEGSEILLEGTTILVNTGVDPNDPNNGSESIDIDEVSFLTVAGILRIHNSAEEGLEVDEGSGLTIRKGATVTIRNSQGEGVEIDEHSFMINHGTLRIFDSGQEGYECDEASRSENYGTIEITNVAQNTGGGDRRFESEGIENDEGSYFLNCGIITMKDTIVDPNTGILIGVSNDEGSYFENQGIIIVNNSDSLGIENKDSSEFINKQDIDLFNVQDTAVLNRSQFTNEVCGIINALDGFVNREESANTGMGEFLNEGQLIIGSFFDNRATFTNTGIIADPDNVAGPGGAGGTIVVSPNLLPQRDISCVKAAIPTLSQWGLIILGLCLSIFGMVAVRQKIIVVS